MVSPFWASNEDISLLWPLESKKSGQKSGHFLDVSSLNQWYNKLKYSCYLLRNDTTYGGGQVMGLLLILFFTFIPFETICFAEPPSVGQIERAQEILQKEEILRNKLEKEEKVYIKKIIVKGATLLDEGKIKEIILPFQKHWLSKTDIQQILDIIGQAYKQKGYTGSPIRISSQIKKNCLEINVEEK